MRAYVLHTGIRVAPLGDLARDLPIGNTPLHQIQRRLCEKFGLTLEVVDSWEKIPTDSPRLVFFDNVWFTRRVLKSFLARWRQKGQPAARLALPLSSVFIQKFSALQDLARTETLALYNCWLLPANQTHTDAQPLEVIYKEIILKLPMPAQLVGVAEWVHPITTSLVFHIRHWIHVLDANILSVQVRWVDAVVANPAWGLWILTRSLWQRGNWRWRILNAARDIRGADIHPTATIEGSFIAPGAQIGAHALVRASIIGPGAIVEDRATVAYSVVGPGAFVSKYALIYTSAVMAQANVGGSIQMCVVGQKAAFTPRTTPMDVIPGGKLKLRDGNSYVPVERTVLGSCFGHDSLVGADIYIAPGREIPNGIRIFTSPERVLATLPEAIEPGATYVVKDGTLVPRGR